MGKGPITGPNMNNTVYDYEWGEVGEERGGPIPGIKEKPLSVDPETGAYTRFVLFVPGFKFSHALQHPFWEELLILEGHMIDYGSNTLYTKGSYGLRQPGVVHGPFGTEIGCTLLETVYYDKKWFEENK